MCFTVIIAITCILCDSVLKLSMPINMKLNIMSCSLVVFVIYIEILFVNFMNSHRILELGKILGNIWFSIYSSYK